MKHKFSSKDIMRLKREIAYLDKVKNRISHRISKIELKIDTYSLGTY